MTRLTPEEIHDIHSFRDQRRRRRKNPEAWDDATRAAYKFQQEMNRGTTIVLLFFLILISFMTIGGFMAYARACAKIGGQVEMFRCYVPPAGGIDSFTA